MWLKDVGEGFSKREVPGGLANKGEGRGRDEENGKEKTAVESEESKRDEAGGSRTT